jgi:redox-sensitive bicupin YhaK (pirin superfamily)
MNKEMKTKLYRAASRGHANYGWLNTNYSFSFADYYNPERIHFGNLRVLNDDIITAENGFGKHPHDNMEIITVPIFGKLTHKDSMGHEQQIGENEVQVMSAGTGIFHSEYNDSKEDAGILQIWIFPKSKNIKPTYSQTWFDPKGAEGEWQFLVNGGSSPLKINQDARISRIKLEAGTEKAYSLLPSSHGSFLFLIEGKVEVEGNELERRDALEITDGGSFNIKATSDSYILNIEV